MYKHRITEQVKYGHFGEYYELLTEFDTLLTEKGFRPFTAWAPTVGTANEIVLETDYPDLIQFDKQTRAILTDSECMKSIRRMAELTVQGTTRDELLETAYQIA